ncbi:MAG: MFS transporter [Thermodesulfobacteriota bacterium]
MLKHTFQNVYWGWWMVLTCALISAYGAGTFHYGFSVFVHPIVTELGWDMALVSGAFSLYRLEAGVAAPLAGYLVDKVGAKSIIALGAVLMGSGYIWLSRVHDILPFYFSFLIISIGFGLSTSQVVGSALISKWFVRKRGKALGLYFSILGLCGLLVPVLSQLIFLYGWRTTLLILGPLTWVVVLPLVLLLKHTPEKYGLRPDGDAAVQHPETPTGASRRAAGDISFSFRNAVRTPSYWLLAVCLSLFQMTMSSIFVHLVPFLITEGFDARLAAVAVSCVTAVSVLGRGGSGWLSDFISKKLLLTACFLMQFASILVLVFVKKNGSVPYILFFILVYGFSYGSLVVLRPSLTAEYYGREKFGTIWGTLQGISLFGGIAGPVVLGHLYDLQGNYRSGLLFISLMNVLAFLFALFLKLPRLKKEQPVQA